MQKKGFVMIKTKTKSQIIVITPEDLEELLIVNECNLRYKVPK